VITQTVAQYGATVTDYVSNSTEYAGEYWQSSNLSKTLYDLFETSKEFIFRYMAIFFTFEMTFFENVQEHYFNLPDNMKNMIQYGAIAYGVFWVLLTIMIFFKRRYGNVSYKSKPGMVIVLCNIIQFFTVVYYSSHILYHVGSHLAASRLDLDLFVNSISPQYISEMFFRLILTSLFEFIPQGRMPSMSYFLVSHVMVVNALLLCHNWHITNLLYIVCDTISIVLYPFLGPYGFYLTIAGSVIGIVTGGLAYSVTPYVSTVLGVHSSVTLVLCIYEYRRMQERMKSNAALSKESYKQKMDDLMGKIKGDKQKEEQVKKLMSTLKASGYDISTFKDMFPEEQLSTKSNSKGKRNNKKSKRKKK